MKTLKTIKDNFKNDKGIQKALKDIKNIKEYKKKVKEIFTNKCVSYLENRDSEKEMQRMKKYLEDEIKRIDDCLNFMREIGKSEDKMSY